MPLNTKTFDQIVSELVTGWSTQLKLKPQLVSGDPLLAIMQSVGSEQMYLQYLCQAVLRMSRASTAEGADLDSWLQDFNYKRLPAIKAQGQVRFSLKNAKSSNVLVPVGKVIQVPGGVLKYEVIRDPIQTAWNESLNGYVMTAGSTQMIATVRALKPGAAYNIQANRVTELVSNFNIDQVTNPVAINDGSDPETDEDARDRFIDYINSLSKNTRPAISAAIKGVQQGIDFNLVECINRFNQQEDGHFTAVIDDGSGNPPDELLTRISLAIVPVRGFTIKYDVVKATKVNLSIEMHFKGLPDTDPNQVGQYIQEALVIYVNKRAIGDDLRRSKLVKIAEESSDLIDYIPLESVLINGLAQDAVATGFEVLRVDTANCNVVPINV